MNTASQTTLAVSEIHVEEGFNPRGELEQKALERLTASIREHGVLVPLVVAQEGGRYRLIAGHRRHRAATVAGLERVPVVVREPDAETRGLDLALVENMAREGLNPVEEAKAFARLIDAGLTRKGVAERLSVSQRLVTERLQLLKLDEALHPRLADGTIPPGAVKPLARLAAIHPGLPAVAVAKVLSPPAHSWGEQTTWADLARDPVALVASDYEGEDQLPADVYEAGTAYPVARFELDCHARKRLEDLCELIGTEPERFQVRFGPEEVEQARALGAVHSSSEGWCHLIVGQAVGEQLAADYIGRCLKAQRKNAHARAQAAAGSPAEDASGEAAQGSAEQEEQRRREEREQAKERRRAATAYNQELGVAVVKQLSKVKVDERVVKVLAAVDLAGELSRIAARGARYGFPGWPREVELKSGATKTEYLSPSEAQEKAREYLAVAKSAGEVAGRLFALVTMARYADEDAVANSARAFHEVGSQSRGLPWSDEVVDLIDQVCTERLPEHLVREQIAARTERREEEERRREQEQAAQQLVAEAIERLAELDKDERAKLVVEVEQKLGERSFMAWRLRQRADELNASTREGADDAESEAEAA